MKTGQELEITSASQGSLQLLKRLGPLAPQTPQHRLHGTTLLLRQPRDQMVFQAQAEDIEIPGQTGVARHIGKPTGSDGIRQQQRRSELLQHRSQPPHTNPKLVERLRILISQHLRLQFPQSSGLALNDLQRIVTGSDALHF
jgi:hypothetical protein